MLKPPIQLFLCCLLLGLASVALAIDEEELLQPEEAFQLNHALKTPAALMLTWTIADGYYLYRHKFKFVSQTQGIEAEAPKFPTGQLNKDKFFGNVQIYRSQLTIELPVQRKDPGLMNFKLEVTYQGCADAGVCYLPIRKIIAFDLPEESKDGTNSAVPPHEFPLLHLNRTG